MAVSVFGGYYKKEESPDSAVYLPNGANEYHFLHFYSPMIFEFDGVSVETSENACIIFRPGKKQIFRGKYGGFKLDYIKFDADEMFFYNVNLPFDEVFYIKDNNDLAEQMKFITWALTDKLTNHEAAIGLAVVKVFDNIQKNRIFPTAKSKRESEMNYRLVTMRNQVRENPEKWTVNLMADNFYLTRTHFTTLYKNYFGISPTDDIHNFIDEKAKKLLSSTDMTVNEIASSCGYSSPENFIRSFKKMNGVSPLQYRKNIFTLPLRYL